jgi:signal transduction histidine kinase
VEGEVKQVLSNLLANAIDACDNDSAIAISARLVRGRDGRPGVRIVVADCGEGIAPQHKAKLFAPFFTTKKNVGTGLGLWITKELVEKAGGSIRLHSRTGRGSGTAVGITYWQKDQLPAEWVI